MEQENFDTTQHDKPQRKPARKAQPKQTQREIDQIEDPVEFREAVQAKREAKDAAIEEQGFLTADILEDLGESAGQKDMQQHELIKSTWGHPRERVDNVVEPIV